MNSRDFFHTHVGTDLCEYYSAAGAVCSLSTNCEQLIEAARGSFLPVETPAEPVDFRMRFWVDDADSAQPPWPKPYVRGLGHHVFLGFDAESSMLADVGERRVIGRFSAAMARDTTHWRTVIFPMMLSVMAGSVGLVELHASCVARDQEGLVLLGSSCSGKSTLAMALTGAGFRLLSDDRTFCSVKQGKLSAHGLPRPLKLRRDVAAWFEELRDQEPGDVQNGERVFFLEPNFHPERQGLPACHPRALLFLERQQSPRFSLIPLGVNEVRSRIEQDLLAEAPEAVEKQERTLENLLAVPSWQLLYGGSPQAIADQLQMAFFSGPELSKSELSRSRLSQSH
jgi:hypothetical protein